MTTPNIMKNGTTNCDGIKIMVNAPF